jgi:hypothetical protein
LSVTWRSDHGAECIDTEVKEARTGARSDRKLDGSVIRNPKEKEPACER